MEWKRKMERKMDKSTQRQFKLNWKKKQFNFCYEHLPQISLSSVPMFAFSLCCVCVWIYVCMWIWCVSFWTEREREGGIATCRHLGPKNMKLSGSDFYPQKQQNYAAKLEPLIRTTDLHLTDLRHLVADTKYWSNILYTDENHEDRSIHSERACSADVKASVTINRRSYLMQSLADLTNLEACFAYWKW